MIFLLFGNPPLGKIHPFAVIWPLLLNQSYNFRITRRYGPLCTPSLEFSKNQSDFEERKNIYKRNTNTHKNYIINK